MSVGQKLAMLKIRSTSIKFLTKLVKNIVFSQILAFFDSIM